MPLGHVPMIFAHMFISLPWPSFGSFSLFTIHIVFHTFHPERDDNRPTLQVGLAGSQSRA